MVSLTLYMGMGGADLGLREAGFESLIGVDLDSDAVLAAQSLDLKAEQHNLLIHCPLLPNIQLVWASPPCPDFSKAGRGVVSTQRRSLEAETKGGPQHIKNVSARLRQLTPTWAVIENVIELLRWEGFEALRAALLMQFPEVCAVCLDAQNFGVPQTRKRVFIVCGPRAEAVRLSLEGVQMPKQTFGEALGFTVDVWRERNKARKIYTPTETGLDLDARWLHRPSPTVTCQEVKGTRASEHARVPWHFNGGPDRASDAAFLALHIRRILRQEAAILQGFTACTIETMAKAGITDAARYRLIGNAVPPAVAQAIGSAILANN